MGGIVDPKQRFSITVEDYHRYRPSYPVELVDWILELAHVASGANVLDLGCGTGITTRLFSARGLHVVGLDPNGEMLAKAAALSRGRWVRGAAEALGLRTGSIALAISGQAFHWFDVPSTCAELARVVRPGGLCCAFWNSRARHGINEDYDVLLRRFSSEYAKLRGGRTTLDDLRGELAGRELHERVFANEQPMTREELKGRARSSSYVAHGVADMLGFERALDELFDRYAEDETVAFEYETAAFAWR